MLLARVHGRAVLCQPAAPRLRRAASGALAMSRSVASGSALSGGTAATGGAPRPTTFRIATYNVLSSHLASPDYYRECKAEDLAAATRLPRVLAKLDAEVQRDAVICLQEVSMTWSGPLFAWFSARGYTFVSHLYGNPNNNYMGVGLAYKTAKYALEAVDICRLSDTKPWPRPARPSGLAARAAVAWASSRMGRAWRALLDRKAPQDDWANARNRYNALVYARLRDVQTGGAFGVATYHMPCAFYAPRVMTIHCALAAQRAAALAAGLPYVLTGDFNIKPSSPQYALLTRGALPEGPEGEASTPLPLPTEPWRPALPGPPLRSAYAEAHAAEPEFTNFAATRGEPAFVDTLDYIFVSQGVQVLDADALPPLASVAARSLPTAEEPSDHVLLAATLRC